jgi:DnaJ-class molecular chaperone
MFNYKFSEEDKTLNDQELYLKMSDVIASTHDIQHYGMLQDEITRMINIFRSNPICEKCTGTGNELLSMFRKCSDCGGDGVKKIREIKSLEDL